MPRFTWPVNLGWRQSPPEDKPVQVRRESTWMEWTKGQDARSPAGCTGSRRAVGP